MKLQEVYIVRLQASQRLFELLSGERVRARVDLSHEKHSLAVAIAQGLTHALFTAALVIIPTVIQKGDAPINGTPDQGDALLLVRL
jgi:hypothetical protein